MGPPTLGVILAGGLGRRMGEVDKPLLRLGGRTLLDRIVERLAPQCAAGLVLSANGDPARFAGFPGPILADEVPGSPGPLAGILAALEHAAARHAAPTRRPHPEVPARARPRLAPRENGIDRVISVSGDAPFLPHDLVARLHAALDADDPRIALAASGEHRHHTVALWPVALRQDLRAALVEREERRVGAFLARHGSVAVPWPTEPYDPFLNVNTAEDLSLAASLVEAGLV